VPCIFCRSEDDLTDEHVFPAFLGGDLKVINGSCRRCNGEFAVLEGRLKDATAPLLHLLRIENRYGVVPNVSVNAEVRGLDMRDLQGFINVDGDVTLFDRVDDVEGGDGRKIRRGFFTTPEAGDRFASRARTKGREVIEREVPEKIIIDANYTLTMPFAFSVEARKIAAKIALTALAFEYGIPFALSPQFDVLRDSRLATGNRDQRVWIFANEGLMASYLRSAHSHSVMCYLSAGWRKGWAVVTLFGGLTYRIDVATEYLEPASKQFSVFYDAVTRKRVRPVVLADEMTLIGHVLSPASKFEDREAVDEQWYPLIASFCAEKGIRMERLRDGKPDPAKGQGGTEETR
jgi:hypothetical protein